MKPTRKYKKRISQKALKEIKDKFSRDYLSGKTYCFLSKKYDICETTVSKLIDRYNLKRCGVGSKTKLLWDNDKYKKHMSLVHLGKIGFWNNKKIPEDVIEKFRKAKLKNPTKYWLGKKCPHFSGKNNPGYVDGNGYKRSEERGRKSRGARYRRWRSLVFERDSYTCQICGSIGGVLHAHHIIAWSINKNLRYKLENGITLCKDCHEKTNNYGNKCKKTICGLS